MTLSKAARRAYQKKPGREQQLAAAYEAFRFTPEQQEESIGRIQREIGRMSWTEHGVGNVDARKALDAVVLKASENVVLFKHRARDVPAEALKLGSLLDYMPPRVDAVLGGNDWKGKDWSLTLPLPLDLPVASLPKTVGRPLRRFPNLGPASLHCIPAAVELHRHVRRMENIEPAPPVPAPPATSGPAPVFNSAAEAEQFLSENGFGKFAIRMIKKVPAVTTAVLMLGPLQK